MDDEKSEQRKNSRTPYLGFGGTGRLKMIKLNNISKIYRADKVETRALENVDLEIKRGEFIGVVGTSGSGKTTLLNILGAMAHPSSGEYFFRDIEVTKLNRNGYNEFRKKYISFVFQHFELMEHYSIFENVEMPLLARKENRRKERVMECLELLRIEDLAKRKPNSLSGGQKQRCAIARALVADAELILADEPTGALDMKTTEDILKIFEHINSLGKTIVLITHDKDVAKHCGRLIQIEDGHLSEREG